MLPMPGGEPGSKRPTTSGNMTSRHMTDTSPRGTPPLLRIYKKVIIITKRLKLQEPSDVRRLIKNWLRDVAETGKLPFQKDGGVIVQMLNVWLKSYELEHELGEWQKLKEQVDRLEEQTKQDNNGRYYR